MDELGGVRNQRVAVSLVDLLNGEDGILADVAVTMF